MLKRLLLVLIMSVMVFSCLPTYAASVGAMTDENTYIDEKGDTYTYQNDKLYKLIDGTLYEVDNGGSQSIIDVMKQKPGFEKPDTEIMGQANSFISKTVGVVLSVIIYVFFALTAFTTACDLAYIGVPPIRGMLYDAGSGNANIHTSVMHGIAQNQAGRAQQAAMQGDMMRANYLQNSAMRSEAEGQYRDQNWFGNRENIERAQGAASGKRCFISRELQSIVNAGAVSYTVTSGSMPGQMQIGNQNQNIILTYLKRRAVSIVLIVVVFMLLVTSTVFTDFGLDVGNMIYRNAAKLLGF